MSIQLKGQVIIPGQAQGEALVANEPLSFWGGYDYHTGTIIDQRHPLAGQKATGRILAVPFTRGSSSTTSILLEAIKAGTAPVGLVTTAPDSFFALAAIVADEMYAKPIPMVMLAEEAFSQIKSGQMITLQADGVVEITDQGPK